RLPEPRRRGPGGHLSRGDSDQVVLDLAGGPARRRQPVGPHQPVRVRLRRLDRLTTPPVPDRVPHPPAPRHPQPAELPCRSPTARRGPGRVPVPDPFATPPPQDRRPSAPPTDRPGTPARPPRRTSTGAGRSSCSS